jgi:hypothetical protein
MIARQRWGQPVALSLVLTPRVGHVKRMLFGVHNRVGPQPSSAITDSGMSKFA